MQVSKNTIRTIFKTWKTQHTVADLRKGRSGLPKSVWTEEKAVVQDLLQSGSKTSIRKLSVSSGIKRTSLNLILRCDLKLKPYKIQQTHEMKPGDDVKRLEFCQRIKELSASGDIDVGKIIFSAELHVYLKYSPNKRSNREWLERKLDVCNEVPLL